ERTDVGDKRSIAALDVGESAEAVVPVGVLTGLGAAIEGHGNEAGHGRSVLAPRAVPRGARSAASTKIAMQLMTPATKNKAGLRSARGRRECSAASFAMASGTSFSAVSAFAAAVLISSAMAWNSPRASRFSAISHLVWERSRAFAVSMTACTAHFASG